MYMKGILKCEGQEMDSEVGDIRYVRNVNSLMHPFCIANKTIEAAYKTDVELRGGRICLVSGGISYSITRYEDSRVLDLFKAKYGNDEWQGHNTPYIFKLVE